MTNLEEIGKLIPKMFALNKLQDFYEETGELSEERWKNFYDRWKIISDQVNHYQGTCLSKAEVTGHLLDISFYDKERCSQKRQELVSAEISCQIESLSDRFLYFNVHLYLKLSYKNGASTCFTLKRSKGKYKALSKAVFDAENLTITFKEKVVQFEKAGTFAEVAKLCEEVIGLTQ